ncbi:MAG: ABC transporter substrate-binding protein [Phycisphaerales bacterium]|nr:ABC transporter substrate-binding protein [Phycisphaerales bacterium]
MPTARTVMQWTRRGVLGALAAGGAGLVLAGPRRAQDAPSDRVVIDYWEKWTQDEGRAMQNVVDRFNASQSRIFVRYFSISDIDRKASIAIAGGSPPDIVGLWNFNVPGYATSGAIQPLGDLFESGTLRMDDYAPAVRRLMMHRGTPYALVNTCGTVGLYYNRKLFKEAGLDPRRPPRTIAELDEYAAKLAIIEPSGRIERAGFVHTEPGWWTWFWGQYFGGDLYDQPTDRSTASSAINTRAYEWVATYPQRYGVKNLVALQAGLGNYGSGQNAFLSGRVAMVLQGPWLANVIARYAPSLDYAVAAPPVDESIYRADEPISLLDSDVLMLPSGCPHPRESMEFLAFTQRPDVVEYLSTVHCKNSPLLRASDEFLANHPNRSVSVHGELAASPRAFIFPRTPAWPMFRDEMEAGFHRIWRLEDSPASVLKKVDVRMQQALDVSRRRLERRRAATGGVS